MSLEKVCDLSALEPAEALRAEVTGERGNKIPIAVVRDEEGGWHAIDALCTHGDVALDEGDVEGCAIECWGHGAQFDLNTGQPPSQLTVISLKSKDRRFMLTPAAAVKEMNKWGN